jgi:hypothetical protein
MGISERGLCGTVRQWFSEAWLVEEIEKGEVEDSEGEDPE